jgi:hypothetical protein
MYREHAEKEKYECRLTAGGLEEHFGDHQVDIEDYGDAKLQWKDVSGDKIGEPLPISTFAAAAHSEFFHGLFRNSAPDNKVFETYCAGMTEEMTKDFTHCLNYGKLRKDTPECKMSMFEQLQKYSLKELVAFEGCAHQHIAKPLLAAVSMSLQKKIESIKSAPGNDKTEIKAEIMIALSFAASSQNLELTTALSSLLVQL